MFFQPFHFPPKINKIPVKKEKKKRTRRKREGEEKKKGGEGIGGRLRTRRTKKSHLGISQTTKGIFRKTKEYFSLKIQFILNRENVPVVKKKAKNGIAK